jgi:hypothetical protein
VSDRTHPCIIIRTTPSPHEVREKMIGFVVTLAAFDSFIATFLIETTALLRLRPGNPESRVQREIEQLRAQLDRLRIDYRWAIPRRRD